MTLEEAKKLHHYYAEDGYLLLTDEGDRVYNLQGAESGYTYSAGNYSGLSLLDLDVSEIDVYSFLEEWDEYLNAGESQ